jgi:cytosine/adenosine deaminase-related metal-dependent hydrolase
MRRHSVCLLTLLAIAACGDNANPGGDPDAASAPDAGPDPLPDAGPAVEPPPFDGEVKCERTVPRPETGICTTTAGTGSAVVVRGNVLADGGEGLDAEVLYDGDTIVCVGCDCSAYPAYATATQIDCGGSVVSAGLINAHDHLNYNNRSPLASTAAGGQRYEHRHQWRDSALQPNNQGGTGAASAGMRWNEIRQAMSGTTSIAGSTLAKGMVRNVDEPEDRDRALGLEATVYQVFALRDGDEDGTTPHTTCDWNYAYSEFQVALMPGLVTHTSEGINDYANTEFRCQSTSEEMGRDFTEKNVGHIHAVGLTAGDYYAMARDDAKLVWSPRSNISLYGETARTPIFHRLGGTIALGTDWTYSGSATLSREMACAAFLDDSYYGDVFTDEDIWRMATINGAKATGTAARLGSLSRGKLADLAVFRAEPGVLHRAVIDATTDDVALVVRDGDVLFGEAAVVAALDPMCDAVDVCGQERRLCATREFGGTTYTAIAAEIATKTPAVYPAIFCETPPAEPTCIPSRPSQYSGELTKADPDGDGVATDVDNCPATFNPIRPMDRGAQADADADGIGDGCDPTPIGDDIDGDGRSNDADVCPLESDDGADADADGKGDACDTCSDQPNPDSVCVPPATSITAIQTSIPARTGVVVDAIVTAIEAEGFYVQDPTVASGENAGVAVFLGERHSLAVGDRVRFAGTTGEYFNMTQIEGATILSSSPGTAIAPVRLTVDAAQDEKYEGSLVTLTVDATTTVEPTYPCGGTCPDTNLWKINGTTGATSFVVVFDRAWQGTSPEWAAAIARAQAGGDVTGVMTWRFNTRRIVPRTPADIGAP